MARLIYSAITSLDGYIEDAAGRFGWGVPDEEAHAFINDLARRAARPAVRTGERHPVWCASCWSRSTVRGGDGLARWVRLPAAHCRCRCSPR